MDFFSFHFALAVITVRLEPFSPHEDFENWHFAFVLPVCLKRHYEDWCRGYPL